MRNMWSLMAAAVICAGLQAGCGGGEEEAPPPPSGPKGVALTMLKAIAAGDGDVVVACYDCSIEDKEYMIKTMSFRRSLMNLGNAGAKAYGSEAWGAATEKAGMNALVPDMTNTEKNMQCTITGDKAVCTLKGFGGTLNLARRGGKWLIVPKRSQFPPLHMRGDILKSVLKTRSAIDAVTSNISDGAVSVDEACAEVKKILNIP
ncbi:MAG: hypothetical protein QGH60_11090 [Phycisphaerae bacterium]|jgi:hypothetical protein|nr:hypothetical protein [Phycisphaerae bacterium]